MPVSIANESVETLETTSSIPNYQPALTQKSSDMQLELPELPAVLVQIDKLNSPEKRELPLISQNQHSSQLRPASVTLDIDETALRTLLEPMRMAFKLSASKVEGILQAYASTGYQAFWLKRDEKGQIQRNSGAEGVFAAIRAAEEDGLDGMRLHSILASLNPLLNQGNIQSKDAAKLDVALSFAAYLYAHDARGGRLDPARLSPLLTPHLSLPDAQSLLVRLAGLDAAQVQGFLQGFQPRHKGYLALKNQLALIRAEAVQTAITRGNGSVITLASAEPGLPTTGRNDVSDEILVNMERWRWLPPDLGEAHIMVNVPAYQLNMVSSGVVIHQTKVIVGRPETPTPIFSDAMEHLIINPSWHVPPSILRNEFLPNLAKDPGYAARKGYEVIRQGNSISVRQPPGERNALGQIKFIFPNHHAVYLHDTPGRHLFAKDTRAFSHGCVRVEAPFRLAERILTHQNEAKPENMNEQALRAMVGKGERMIRLRNTMPVHLTYFTLHVDEGGVLTRAKDIYGHDARMRAALLPQEPARRNTAFLQ